MNPTKQLRKELNIERAENAKLEKLYVKMTNDYGELITSNIELEKRSDAMTEDLASFCESCSEREGALCQECLLNKWLY